MLKGWQDAGRIQGEKLRARIIGEYQLQASAKRGRVAMAVCIASDTVLVSYRIREHPLVPPKIPVKSVSCFRARRHPAGRRKHFARFQILVFIS